MPGMLDPESMLYWSLREYFEDPYALTVFIRACKLAGITPCERQARKYERNTGGARKFALKAILALASEYKYESTC